MATAIWHIAMPVAGAVHSIKSGGSPYVQSGFTSRSWAEAKASPRFWVAHLTCPRESRGHWVRRVGVAATEKKVLATDSSALGPAYFCLRFALQHAMGKGT
jgi:hypothetical protein